MSIRGDAQKTQWNYRAVPRPLRGIIVDRELGERRRKEGKGGDESGWKEQPESGTRRGRGLPPLLLTEDPTCPGNPNRQERRGEGKAGASKKIGAGSFEVHLQKET